MRQLIFLQIGQCGNNIGSQFWKMISDEHSIDATGNHFGDSYLQTQRIDTYFNQLSNGKFVPRAILSDLEPGTLDHIKGGPIGRMFMADNFIFAQKGAGNNWAKGFYGQGAHLMDHIFDLIRKQAEGCDLLQGFQLTHALGGGTGSGMGSLLLQKIKQEFSNKVTQTFSIFPSQKVSDTVVEPYNAVLSLHHLIQKSEGCVVLDNEGLYNICSKTLKIQKPTYSDINHITSLAMSGVTCSMRFRSLINSDLRKMLVNLVPFPRQHFFMVSQSPIFKKDSKLFKDLNKNELLQQLFDAKNMMTAADPRHGRFMSGFIAFRGGISPSQIEWPYIIYGKNSSYFVEWIPNNIKGIICNIPPKGINRSGTYIGNSTSIIQVFRRLTLQFDLMFKKRAFVHWYTDEGLDQLQFQQAYVNMNDLCSQYLMSQDATADQYQYQQSQA